MKILMRMKNAGNLFISRSYIGEHVSGEKGVTPVLKIKDTCAIYEQLEQEQSTVRGAPPVMAIKRSYQTDSLFSNGTLSISCDDVEFVRDIDESDEVLKGYYSAFQAFDENKAKLNKPKSSLVIPAGAQN